MNLVDLVVEMAAREANMVEVEMEVVVTTEVVERAAERLEDTDKYASDALYLAPYKYNYSKNLEYNNN